MLRISPKMNKNKTYKILMRSSGVILLVLILLKLDTRKILESLANKNMLLIFPLFSVFLGHTYFRVKRWRLLLVNSKLNITGKNLFSIYVGSFLPGAITPGRIGEIIKYRMLKSKKFDSDLGLVLSVQDRIWDISLPLLIGSMFMVYVSNEILYVLYFLPCVIIFIFASLRPELVVCFIVGILQKYLPNVGFTKKMFVLSKNIIPLSKVDLIKCLIFTIFSWLTYFLQVYFIFCATGIKYSFIFVSCAIAAAGLIALLPISIAGIGTRDIALVGLFILSDKPPEAAITLSTCILLIFLANCVISFPFWIYESKSLVTT